MNPSDTTTQAIPDIELRDCHKCNGVVTLYRVTNRAGLLYSSIDCKNCGELTSMERTDEQEMIDLWNGGDTNSKNPISDEETAESDT